MFGWGETKETLEKKRSERDQTAQERAMAATAIQRTFRGFKGRIALHKLQAGEVRKEHMRRLEVDKKKRREYVLRPKNEQVTLAIDENRYMELVHIFDTTITMAEYSPGDVTVQLDKDRDVVNLRYRERVMGETFLIRACRLGKMDVAEMLLAREGVNVHDTDDFGLPALGAAAKHGHLHLCAMLLERGGARIYARDHDQWTALLHASAEGHWHVVEYLLRNKGDVTAVTSFGDTALHKAAGGGHLVTAKLLALRSDVNLNATNDQGFTALLQAAYFGRGDVVRFLASLDIVDTELRNGVGQNVRNLLPSLMAVRNYGGARVLPRDLKEARHELLAEMVECMEAGVADRHRLREEPYADWSTPRDRAQGYRQLALEAIEGDQYAPAVLYAGQALAELPDDEDLARFERRARHAKKLHIESMHQVLGVRRRAQAEIDYATARNHLKDKRYADAARWFGSALEKDDKNEKYRAGQATALRLKKEEEIAQQQQGNRRGARDKGDVAVAAGGGGSRACGVFFCS